MAKVKIVLTDTVAHGSQVLHQGDTMEVDEGAELTIMLARGHKRFDEVRTTPSATVKPATAAKTTTGKPASNSKPATAAKTTKDEDLA